MPTVSGNLFRLQYKTQLGWAMACFIEPKNTLNEEQEEIWKSETLSSAKTRYPDHEWRIVEETGIPREKILADPYAY
jgi:hypothetical protein